MEKKNLALTIMEPGRMALVPQEIPVPKEDEVLIEVHYVAVCGSDVKLYAGTYTAPHSYPVVMGHEWLGTIRQKGSDVSLPVGLTVVGDCSLYCGECYYCGVNKNHCETIEKKGITVDGGAANFIVVKERHVNACPSSDHPMLLTLTEPMSVAVNGIRNRVPDDVLKRTRRALILGCGGIGLMSLFTLLDAGIPEIVMVDVLADKVSRVQGFGFPQVRAECCNTQEISEERIGTFDLIVEATGHSESLQQSLTVINPCGHLVCLGHQAPMEFDFGTVVKKSLTIHASNGSTGGFPKAMEQILTYSPYVEQMIMEVVPLSECEHLFERKELFASAIKVLIDMTK
ncbi:MAG: alcohol dehydrogenase catalytic domain-containing protein [Clostridiales bacterium]|nr:alcohol dehydrogenase catalytic domain-containing protein [Clostridiales bacterium]